jgi:signal transduction histidine kinase
MSGETLSISGDPFKRFNISSLGQAALIVPIKVQKQVIGVLVTLRRAPKPFEASEQNLLEAISDYASISLVNSRLFRALDERARSLHAAVENSSLNEKIKNDLMRGLLKAANPPVRSAAGAVERLLQGQTGVITTDQAQRLLALQEHLLELARIVETSNTLEHITGPALATPANLNNLSRQAISAVQQIAQHVNVTLVGELSAEPVLVQAVPIQLFQVIVGLLSNAVKYSPANGQVVLRAFKDGQLAHLTVRDNGPGIDARHQSHLFDSDYVVGNLPAHAFSGLGIRLSLMKELLTAQGGKIWAESQPGRGTTFHVTLSSIR